MHRRPRTGRLVWLVALLISTTAIAQDWSGRGRVQGRVTDEAGKPIPLATITIHPADDPEVGPKPFSTNKKGEYRYLGLRGGNYVISAAAEGFITVERLAQVNEFGSGVRVDLELKANPFNAINEGNELLDAGDYTGARAKFEEVIDKVEPEQRVALRTLIADTYFEEGNAAAAQPIYEETLQELPAEQQLHVLIRLGDCYLQSGDLDAALNQFEMARAQLAPADQAPIMVKVAQIQDMQGNRSLAIDTLKAAQASNPGDVGVIQLLADLLMREDRNEEAQEYLAQLPEDAVLPSDMVLNLGIRDYNNGNMDAAFEHFERAVEEHPDLAAAYYYRGLVYLSRGENEHASADFNKFLELDPAAPQAGEAKEFLEFLKGGQ